MEETSVCVASLPPHISSVRCTLCVLIQTQKEQTSKTFTTPLILPSQAIKCCYSIIVLSKTSLLQCYLKLLLISATQLCDSTNIFGHLPRATYCQFVTCCSNGHLPRGLIYCPLNTQKPCIIMHVQQYTGLTYLPTNQAITLTSEYSIFQCSIPLLKDVSIIYHVITFQVACCCNMF